jgi:hypothetical protein
MLSKRCLFFVGLMSFGVSHAWCSAVGQNPGGADDAGPAEEAPANPAASASESTPDTPTADITPLRRIAIQAYLRHPDRLPALFCDPAETSTFDTCVRPFLDLFSPAQLAFLPPEHIARLSAQLLNGLSPEHVAVLTPPQVAATPPAHIAALSEHPLVDFLPSFTPEQLHVLTTAQLALFSIDKRTAFTTEKLAHLRSPLPTEWFCWLPPETALALPEALFPPLSTTGMYGLSCTPFGHWMREDHWERPRNFPPRSFPDLTVQDCREIGWVLELFPERAFPNLTVEEALSFGCRLSHFPQRAFPALTVKDCQALGDIMSYFPPCAFLILSVDDCTALNANAESAGATQDPKPMMWLFSLPVRSFAALTQEEIASLSNETLRSILDTRHAEVTQMEAVQTEGAQTEGEHA